MRLGKVWHVEAGADAARETVGYLLDEREARDAASGLGVHGGDGFVAPFDAIIFEDTREALPRLGGRRVKISENAAQARQDFATRRAAGSKPAPAC